MRFAGVLILVVAVAGCLQLPPNADLDNDQQRNVDDNCKAVANPDQSDFDGDGTGDACDECVEGGEADDDADGIPDGCDGCIGNGEDADEDGIPDNCDGCLEAHVDVDEDGLDDACDACVGNGIDSDGDEIDDNCDSCIEVHRDVDLDLIDDGCDSCIESGKDGDGDGVDTACDPCLNGPQHDEDMDGLFDGCDNCPAVSNLDQVNVLEGGINPGSGLDAAGDACDSDPEINYRIFDAFDRQNTTWFVQGANWLLDEDQMRFVGGALSYRMLGTAYHNFVITTHVVPADPNFVGGFYRVFIANDWVQPAPARVECEVDTTGSIGSFTLRVVPSSGDPPTEVVANGNVNVASATIELSFDEANKTITCRDLKGGAIATAIAADTGIPWLPGIAVATTQVNFDYFEIISRDN